MIYIFPRLRPHDDYIYREVGTKPCTLTNCQSRVFCNKTLTEFSCLNTSWVLCLYKCDHVILEESWKDTYF